MANRKLLKIRKEASVLEAELKKRISQSMQDTHAPNTKVRKLQKQLAQVTAVKRKTNQRLRRS